MRGRRGGWQLPERPSEGQRLKAHIAAQLLAGELVRLYRARVDDRPHAAGPRLDVALVTHVAETHFRGGLSEGGGRYAPVLDLKLGDLGVEWFLTPAEAFAGLVRRLRLVLSESRRQFDLAERRLSLAEEGGRLMDAPASTVGLAPPGGVQLELPGTGRATCRGCWTTYRTDLCRRCPVCALKE